MMMRFMFGIMVLGGVLLNSGCQPHTPMGSLNYSGASPMVLAVNHIDVDDQDDGHLPDPDPKMTGEVFLTPARDQLRGMVLAWKQDRLVASGLSSGQRAQLIIHKIAMTRGREKLPQGFFEKTPSDVYRAQVSVTLALLDQDGYPAASASGSVDRAISVSQNATLSEREATIHNVQVDVMNELNTILEREMKEHLESHMGAAT